MSKFIFKKFTAKVTADFRDFTKGGRSICNLNFAEDVDLMGRNGTKLQYLTNKLESCTSAYGMEISTEKNKILVNSTAPVTPTNIRLKGQKLVEADTFKFLGATLNKEGTSPKEIQIRLAIAFFTMSKLTKVLKNNNIRPGIKIKLYKALITSIALYASEAETPTAETRRRIQTL